MSLKHGILGFLSQWPETTGYELKKEFDTSMNMIWFSHLSQIYPELNKLEKDELVQSKVIKQEGKPDKKTYTITKKGMKELKSWVSKQPETPKIKDSFLMQIFFMDKIPLEEAIFLLRTYQREREKRLKKMQVLVKENLKEFHDNSTPLTARMLMGMAVYKRGINQEKQYIQWCKATIDLLESFSPLWTGDGTDQVELENPETSGLQGVPGLPFEKVQELLLKYFEDELSIDEEEDLRATLE